MQLKGAYCLWLCAPYLVGTHGQMMRQLAAHKSHLLGGFAACQEANEPPGFRYFHAFLMNVAPGVQDSRVRRRPCHGVIM